MPLAVSQSVMKDLAEEPAFSEDGVDLTLIRWMLSLSPTERVEALQSFMDGIAEMMNAATTTAR